MQNTPDQVLDLISRSLPGYTQRQSQIDMVRSVWEAFNEKRIHVIEAPTGTGKSLGYLIPGILAALQNKKTLIVSTGSVGLQEQIVNKDLPFLRAHSGLEFTFKLVKGRSRYFCEREARALAGKSVMFNNWDPGASTGDIRRMIDDFETGRWNGDSDTLKQAVSAETWASVANNRNSCTASKCMFYGSCSFFAERRELPKNTVLVVNHDLLLSDLVHSARTGKSLLPEMTNSYLVIDEAHHLAKKAVEHNSFTVSILRSIDLFNKDIVSAPLHACFKKSVESFSFIAQELLRQKLIEDPTSRSLRFPTGGIPSSFSEWVKKETESDTGILATLAAIAEDAKAVIEESKTDDSPEAQMLLRESAFLLSKANNALDTWSAFMVESSDNPKARWFTFVEHDQKFDLDLSVAPLAAKPVLQTLWNKTSGAVLTSATLRSLGTFDLISRSTGLGSINTSKFISLDSPFDLHGQGALCIPEMSCDPTSEPDFSNSVADWLTQNLPAKKGSIVLFTSNLQMNAVFNKMPEKMRAEIILQSSGSRSAILADHAVRVGQKKRSVLFGVAGLYEGLDLPGDLCVMVVVVRIPFSTPTDPIEESRHEYMKQRGKNAFMELSLPEASFRLVQMAGRLIRTERDRGTLVILDRRIKTKFYGEMLRKSLPPFRLSKNILSEPA